MSTTDSRFQNMKLAPAKPTADPTTTGVGDFYQVSPTAITYAKPPAIGDHHLVPLRKRHGLPFSHCLVNTILVMLDSANLLQLQAAHTAVGKPLVTS